VILRSEVKGEGHSETTHGQVSTYKHFLASLGNAGTYFSEAYNSYLLPGPHDDEILKVMG